MSRRGLPLGRVRRVAGWVGAGLAGGVARLRSRARGEAGMTTAEYAVGTLAACAFAALLIAVVRSPEIREALLGLIVNALGMGK